MFVLRGMVVRLSSEDLVLRMYQDDSSGDEHGLFRPRGNGGNHVYAEAESLRLWIAETKERSLNTVLCNYLKMVENKEPWLKRTLSVIKERGTYLKRTPVVIKERFII